MAKKKSVSKPKSQERREAVSRPKQEGDIDPYSAGKKIANPEPDNNKGNGPRVSVAQQAGPIPVMPSHKVRNSDEEEQAEVGKGRKEK